MFKRSPFIMVLAFAMACYAAVLVTIVTPAFAQVATSADSPNSGMWALVNPYLVSGVGTIVSAAFTWVLAQLARFLHVKLTADTEERIRQCVLTGIYLGITKVEARVDQSLTADKRDMIVKTAVTWAMSRMPSPIARLGMTQDVVGAIAIKMLGGVMTSGGASSSPLDDVSSLAEEGAAALGLAR